MFDQGLKMRHGLLLIKKDLERIWKQHCAMLLVYVVVLALSRYYTRPEETFINFHYWTAIFSLMLAGGWSIYFIVDERRKKTIVFLLSLPISLRELVTAKFQLQLLTAVSTYLFLYLLGGFAILELYNIDVFLHFSALACVVAGIIVLMSFLVACTFLFSPTLAYVIVMLVGLAVVASASLMYQAGWFHVDTGQLQRLVTILQHPGSGAILLLAALLVGLLAAQLTWRILSRRDPVELAV